MYLSELRWRFFGAAIYDDTIIHPNKLSQGLPGKCPPNEWMFLIPVPLPAFVGFVNCTRRI